MCCVEKRKLKAIERWASKSVKPHLERIGVEEQLGLR